MRSLLFVFVLLITASRVRAQNCDKIIVTERNTYPSDHYHRYYSSPTTVSELETRRGWIMVAADTIQPLKKGEVIFSEQIQKNKTLGSSKDGTIKAEVFALKFKDTICLELRIRDASGSVITHMGNDYERLQLKFGEAICDYPLRRTKYKDGIRLLFQIDGSDKLRESMLDSSKLLQTISWHNEVPDTDHLKRLKKKKQESKWVFVYGIASQQLLELTISRPEAEKLRQALICLTK